MDPVLFLFTLFVAFLAGSGLGVFVFATTVHKTLDAAKAEFTALRHEAQEKITEAENAIRRVL
jgi:hypothetical protein